MAIATSLSISIDSNLNLHFHRKNSRFLHKPISFIPKSRPRCFKSDEETLNLSSSTSTSTTSIITEQTPENPETSSILGDPIRTKWFLTDSEYQNLKSLQNFSYQEELKSGFLQIRVMRPDEIDPTSRLIADSFSDLFGFPDWGLKLLIFLVKQSLTERRAAMPHAATLVGFYREEGGEEELAGTVEVVFDGKGVSDSTPTPSPPKDMPYVGNMAVEKGLRRRGIGSHLLKASEKLISEMSPSREVYLHCRMIDAGPFNMYSKAGYSVVKTDSIFKLLTLQRRKHLMCKNLPTVDEDSEPDISGAESEEGLDLPVDV